MNGKTVVSILITIFLGTLLVIIGCGALDDNTQPEIDPINDKTLDIGDTRTVSVYITDIDIDDIHTIHASSDNPNVATVSVDEDFEDSLIVTGNAAGIARITVSASDDSGQDSAEAIPVTFQVTVKEPPSPPIDKGACYVGMTLQPGESCSYFADQVPITFYINKDNEGCRTSKHTFMTEIFGLQVPITVEFICADEDIKGDEINIRGNNPFDTNFHASKNRDGSWTVKKVP